MILFTQLIFSTAVETSQFPTTKSANFYEMLSCDFSDAFVFCRQITCFVNCTTTLETSTEDTKASNMTAITEVWSASIGLVLYVQHIFANSVNFLITWKLPVTICRSACIFRVYGMALYKPTLQLYVCVYVSFVCQYVESCGECYYNTMLRLFFIVKCGIACFPCAMCVFKVWASCSPPRLPLCQILFLSQLPLLS